MSRCQQYELYAAEHDGVPNGRVFDRLTQLRTFVEDLVLDPWFTEHYPHVIGVVVEDRGSRTDSTGTWFADTGVGQIEMARSHWDARTVCHELAHVTADSEGSRSHCPIFAQHYLELIRHFIGLQEYAALKLAFDQHGIIYRKARA